MHPRAGPSAGRPGCIVGSVLGMRHIRGPIPGDLARYGGEPGETQARAMAKRLYVGNLSYQMTSEELQALFESFGPVRSAQVLSDRETGRSRGFGFVEMENDPEAEAAIEALDGQDHMGRRLTVNEAKPR